MFRNQAARHLGCLLDVDQDVISWTCLPLMLERDSGVHIPDFLVEKGSGSIVMDAVEGREKSPALWIASEAAAHGYEYVAVPVDEIGSGFRLWNAVDLLRYSRWQCPLGDRIRLLAALDEHGTLSVADCFPAFQETRPIAGLSSLILNRFVEVDLDEALIGPETSVRRWRD
ncbi:hypothetical protein [Chelativorans sp. AA-79]|uniref:hypothetical protein n=1 Tax=Chelativorans sp. AA-79 TaxID=3028735 RepID=UPI0023F990CF|nr:hypothetical protein [Chelativorans sp. AA-79]WEX11684.1 hypothetical protein PVE73_12530 [Chelativorans sp. AA-79]